MEAKARNFATCIPTGIQGLTDKHHDLLYKEYCLKILVPSEDDTSDNWSKQYNPYKSWSMKFAAMSYEELCMAINILLLGIVQKRNGYSGLSLLPTLVKNFKKLENGMVMYSAEHGEYVLVVAPLLLIEADTPCHSELCGILGPATLLPCRKCYCVLRRNVFLEVKEYFLKKHMPRTWKHYVMTNSTDKRETIMPDVLGTNTPVNARALSFVNHSSGCLLELKAFDPSKDTPVEILHTILLGTAKYLINELVKKNLKPHPDKLERLANGLKEHDISTGLSRKDFKVLLQILPGALLRDFSDNQKIETILPCFVELGHLCSLVFVRQIESRFEEYITQVNHAVNSLIAKLHESDMANVANLKHLPLSTKPKTHNMIHLTEDIRRFGPALNFETEKGEQFNKYIREHLIRTNRLNTLRDICHKFTKQAVMQHIFANGS
ncbi:hypothetical protein F4703DRAFT_1968613 [Phycomyces blakesleeanus]